MASGETKSELRGHEHVVEAAVFAPLAAYPALVELSGGKVRPAPFALFQQSLRISNATFDHPFAVERERRARQSARSLCRHRFARQDDPLVGYDDRAVHPDTRAQGLLLSGVQARG